MTKQYLKSGVGKSILSHLGIEPLHLAYKFIPVDGAFAQKVLPQLSNLKYPFGMDEHKIQVITGFHWFYSVYYVSLSHMQSNQTEKWNLLISLCGLSAVILVLF